MMLEKVDMALKLRSNHLDLKIDHQENEGDSVQL